MEQGDYNTKQFDFLNYQDLRNTIPVSFSFYGKQFRDLSWKQIYARVVSFLFADHSGYIKSLSNVSLDNSMMRSPYKIEDTDYYLDTHMNLPTMGKKIAQILSNCDVSFDEVVIFYKRKDLEMHRSSVKIDRSNKKDRTTKRNGDWNIYEALILLDECLKISIGELSEDMAAEDISKKLNRMGLMYSSEFVDDKYRNIAGVKFHIYGMRNSLFGEDFKVHSSAILDDAVDIYNNKSTYQDMLSEAYKRCGSPIDLQGCTDYSSDIDFSDNRTSYTVKYLRNEIDKILKVNLYGISFTDLYSRFPYFSQLEINQAALSLGAVFVGDNIIYEDKIFGYSEMADILATNLAFLFDENDNYCSAVQLYNQVHVHLKNNKFFFNNGWESCECVYDLAKHLFTKEKYNSETYIFAEGTHIWRVEPEYSKDFCGLLYHYFKLHHIVLFSVDDANKYLSSICLPSKNISFGEILDENPQIFLHYDSNRYIVAEALDYSNDFIEDIKSVLERSFDGYDYLIFGNIDEESFYSLLPALPRGIKWTSYIFREILNLTCLDYFVLNFGNKKSNSDSGVPSVICKKCDKLKKFSDVLWFELAAANDYKFPIEFTVEQLIDFIEYIGFINKKVTARSCYKIVGGDDRFFWYSNNTKLIVSNPKKL